MHAIIIERKSIKPSTFNVINSQQDKSIQTVKIIDLIRRRINARERFYSIEVSPSDNLLLNFNDFTVQPLFTSVTWFKDNVEIENDAVEPAVQLINAITSTATLLHLTCYKMTESKLEKLLLMKITNVLALRGDIVTSDQLLQHAIDLVKLIKTKSRSTSIAVGGYPELHPESLSKQSDMNYLKEKVEAGTDFVITQTCFSSTQILQFIANCRDVGITVPIVPGIYIPSSYKALIAMCRVCKVKVPEEDFRVYKLLRNDPKEFQDYAVEITTKLLHGLFSYDEDPVGGVHFFTLNNFELLKRVTSNFDFK